MSRELLRKLPKVDELLLRPSIVDLIDRLPRDLIVDAVREVLDGRRQQLLSGQGQPGLVAVESIEADVTTQVAQRLSPRLRPVINATGVVLHTNLGRAPLGREILADAIEIAAGYSNLEYDLPARRRGSRYSHSAELLRRITGAEDSLVVNNNAGAMVLMLMALASGKEVVVSRGELIEIGGSFRLPDIFSTSGARMVEVGTTNRTHLRDYEAAITDDTALMMKVHRSNFEIVGFTAEVDGAELAKLGRERGVPTCEDLGSGCMVDLSSYGISSHTAAHQVGLGLDIVTFSGDKMLGGPQAGIIVGRADLIKRIRSHPLTRAMRVDKLTLATLERTLISYVDGTWQEKVPALQALTASAETLNKRAEALAALVRTGLGAAVDVTIEDSEGRVGGGALPQTVLPGRAVRVRLLKASAVATDHALRAGELPIVCRIDEDSLVFDVRTVFDAQLGAIADHLKSVVVEP